MTNLSPTAICMNNLIRHIWMQGKTRLGQFFSSLLFSSFPLRLPCANFMVFHLILPRSTPKIYYLFYLIIHIGLIYFNGVLELYASCMAIEIFSSLHLRELQLIFFWLLLSENHSSTSGFCFQLLKASNAAVYIQEDLCFLSCFWDLFLLLFPVDLKEKWRHAQVFCSFYSSSF